MRADGNFAAQGLLDVGRRGKVVGMDVGLQDPLHFETLLADEGDDLVGAGGADGTRWIVEIEH